MTHSHCYLLVYYEPPHKPKYFLTSKTNLNSTNFESVKLAVEYAKKKKHIGIEHIHKEIEDELFEQIKENIGYNNTPYVIRISDLEKMLSK